MVALFGSSAKASSTSPRKSGSSSATGVADASTSKLQPQTPSPAINTRHTEGITTPLTETVHFLSLPLWRKRPQYNTPNHVIKRPQTVSASRSYLMDKELPPTPVDHATDVTQSRLPLRETGDFGELTDKIYPRHHPPGDHVQRSQSTSALAQAVLDVGLPHAIPRTSSSSSEANTVSLTLPAIAVKPSTPMSPSIRKSKSTQMLDAKLSSPMNDRRKRGLSFGTTSFLHFPVNDPKGKGKEKEHDTAEGRGNSRPEKQLSRKPSFWSRKKSIQSNEAPGPSKPDSNELPLPTLPRVQPCSPLDVQYPLTSTVGSEDTRSYHARGLSRSQSARDWRRDAESYIGKDSEYHVTRYTGVARKRPSTAGGTTISQKNTHNVLRISTNGSSLTPSPNGITDHVFSGEQSTPSIPRPRALTTPPLLHRLSLNMFHSSNSQLKLNVNPSDVAQVVSHVNSKEVPKISDNESPEEYLCRLKLSVPKKEIAAVLASSAEPVYSKMLRAYIEGFDFTNDALDIALRKLLMEVGLPHETQQIDRVIEAFAAHYIHCNPSLFSSDDHPYVLAFSLIMLHTDAFNKSNKHKMTKADYVKNTRLPGVAQEVLEYFYDNIVFAPFIFVEEPWETIGQHGTSSPLDSRSSMSITITPVSAAPTGNPLLNRTNKVDPYYLIGNKLLDPLRVSVESWISADDLYSTFEYATGPYETLKLHDAFVRARRIHVEMTGSSYTAASSSYSNHGSLSSRREFSERPMISIIVAKSGVLQRKDDLLEGGKRVLHRKWKSWTVILAGFYLLFFRDTSLASSVPSLQSSSEDEDMTSVDVLQPDEVIPVKNSIAVFDSSYHKHQNTLRFVLGNGKQILLQSAEEKDTNEWVSKINYASAFRSTGIKMRSPTMPALDVELTGVAAATSHLHDMQRARLPTTPRTSSSTSPSAEVSFTETNQGSSLQQKFLMPTSDEVNVPIAPEVAGADQFKATFDLVKAQLASDTIALCKDVPETASQLDLTVDMGDRALLPHSNFASTRSYIMEHKIEQLKSKIDSTQQHLDDAMRLIRNISILAPFQKSTRDRLSATVQATGNNIKRIRLELRKYRCYHDILSQDLAVEEQEWNRTKYIALKAARKTLHQQQSEGIPQMTFSAHGGDEAGSTSERFSSNPDSSTCGSFHSALDFGPEWPSSDELSGSFLSTGQVIESPRPSTSESASSYPFSSPDESRGLQARSSILEDLSTTTSPGDSERSEQAEAWDETRYAQRVSLIRVPSGIALPMLGKMA